MSIIVFLLIMLSASFHALWNFSAKKASGNFYVMYWGLLIACAFFSPILLLTPEAEIFQTKSYPYILTTGTTHAIYFLALAKAYEHGDISTSYPIARGTGIAGTTIAACFFLNEEIKLMGAVGVLLISFGTILIGLKHASQKNPYKGLVFALLVGLMIVSYSMVDKQGVDFIHPLVYNFGIFFVSALWLTPYILIKRKKELVNAWKKHKKYSFIIGIGSFTTYLIILFVFQIAQVSYVVALRETSVVIGALLGFRFLGEKCTNRKIIGIILIVIGMVAIKMV